MSSAEAPRISCRSTPANGAVLATAVLRAGGTVAAAEAEFYRLKRLAQRAGDPAVADAAEVLRRHAWQAAHGGQDRPARRAGVAVGLQAAADRVEAGRDAPPDAPTFAAWARLADLPHGP